MRLRWASLATTFAVLGPGLLAGLSDNDPAGITTYSALGAEFGYELLWVLLFASVALLLFSLIASRLGLASGQGLAGLIRERFGARPAGFAVALLVLANIGTMMAEFAGIAAGCELFGIPREISVVVSAVLVSALVLRGSFQRVERVLLVLAAVFIAYVAAGFVAQPDWAAAFHGLIVPSMPGSSNAMFLAAATIGTTLAPWGIAFIQSNVVNKRLDVSDLRTVRIDVFAGSTLSAVVAFFVVVTTAATLYGQGVVVDDAAQAAQALVPLVGRFAEVLFGVGLIGAGLLAACILPISTAYSVADVAGRPADIDDTFSKARLFYLTFLAVTIFGAIPILIPNVPLVAILLTTQVLNAVLLIPLMVFMVLLVRNRELMGKLAVRTPMVWVYMVTIAVVTASVAMYFVLQFWPAQ